MLTLLSWINDMHRQVSSNVWKVCVVFKHDLTAVAFRSNLCYAVSAAYNALPLLFWQNLQAFKPPLQFSFFRKSLAPDPHWWFLFLQNPCSNQSSQELTPRNSLCRMWLLSNCLLHSNSWKAGARVWYFRCTSYTLGTHIAVRNKGRNEREKEENDIYWMPSRYELLHQGFYWSFLVFHLKLLTA